MTMFFFLAGYEVVLNRQNLMGDQADFPQMLTSPIYYSNVTTSVVVTEQMIQAYEKIVSGGEVFVILLFGPPGCGKTTSLYWLFKQVKELTEYKPVCATVSDAHPIQSSDLSSPDNYYVQRCSYSLSRRNQECV